MWHESMIISKARVDMQMSAQMGISVEILLPLSETLYEAFALEIYLLE